MHSAFDAGRSAAAPTAVHPPSARPRRRVGRPRPSAAFAGVLSAGLLGASACSDEEVFEALARYEPAAALAFGPTNVASEATLTVEVSNNGNAGLRIEDVRVEQPDTFIVDASEVTDGLIGPGESAVLSVSYRPCPAVWNGDQLDPDADLTTCPGEPAVDQLVVTDSTEAGGVTIALSGTPVQPPNCGFRCVSGGANASPSACGDADATRSACSTLDFGQVRANQDEACDLYLELTNSPRTVNGVEVPVAPCVIENGTILVNNTGTGQIPAPLVSGEEAGLSLRDESGAPLSFPLTIDVPTGVERGSELIRARFTGAQVGVFSSFEADTGLRFSTNDPSQPLKVLSILATGSAPDIESRQLIDFGPVPQGTSATRSIRIQNQGDVPLEITSSGLVSGNPEFVFEAADNSPVAPREVAASGGEFTVNVTYTPTDPSNDREFWQIASNDPDESPYEIEIRGGPQPSLCPPPQVVSFPPTVSSAASTRPVTLESCGTGVLSITGFDIRTSGNPASVDDFSVDVPGCETLPCTIEEQLCPADQPGCEIEGEQPGISFAFDVTYQNNDVSTIDLADLIVFTDDPSREEVLISLNAEDNPCVPPTINVEVVRPDRPCVPDPVFVRVTGDPGGPTAGGSEPTTLVNCSFSMAFGTTQIFTPNDSVEACSMDGVEFVPQMPGGLHIVRAEATNSCGASTVSPPEQITVAPNCN